MKLKATILIFFFFCLILGNVKAQFKKKDRIPTPKEQKSKATKEAKKQSRLFRDQGYLELPGDLTIEEQVFNSTMSKYELDSLGNPVYIVVQSEIVGNSFAEAKRKGFEKCLKGFASNVNVILAEKYRQSILKSEPISRNQELFDFVKTFKFDFSWDMFGRKTPIILLKKKSNNQTFVVMSMRYKTELCYGFLSDYFIKQIEETMTLSKEELNVLKVKQLQ
ncbi:hypothetical protein KMW28_11600 [Flammeovirga yaeyamensis]|uniref:Uncharacterized protein n=1 Tax=Flammeovirga yaeyamensis TaxID=367791 RepID=A0AAX1N1S3_9BACT|nr:MULTISPECIES: hypothetical protein [Flammeovirga]ANQ48290.1 hypothetical protein MY04_0908 [Flammeovirga sp. MY04]MBB3696194.1 hypothetical protein [Flammeovirga yaeyamensis]NMF34877.1 hypothetical protein [Flammeovirga yaeyamensis]QWG00296.1 hypothetical protein KMW28_11600 [Flammeovirga yaeyamensis]